MEPVTNNRFRPTPVPAQTDSLFASGDISVDIAPATKNLETVHEEEMNGQIPASPAVNNNNRRGNTRVKSFSLKQVRRNISKQLSLDDFDWDAAKRRNEQIEQIALNDQEQYNAPVGTQSKLEKAWIGLLGTLSDTFLIARLAIKLMAYLGGGTHLFLLLMHRHSCTHLLDLQCDLRYCHAFCRWHLGVQVFAALFVHFVVDAWVCTGMSSPQAMSPQFRLDMHMLS